MTRRSTVAKKGKTAAPKTRGPKTKFSPSRMAFLTGHLPAYFACAVRKRYKNFWNDILPQYWRKFPWYIPVNVEPSDDNIHVVEDDSPEGLAQKQSAIESITKVSSGSPLSGRSSSSSAEHYRLVPPGGLQEDSLEEKSLEVHPQEPR